MKNQIEQTNFIKNKFSTYLRSTFDIRDSDYNELYNKRLDDLESKLYKGPYLASTKPFKPSKSINQLIEEGNFEEEYKKIGLDDFDRPCYEHQIRSFEKIQSGHNVVVTTGTGSGKTECFLLPIINELIKEVKQGNIEPGVRAIFLFPLNALVYDQIGRLRDLLKGYSEIRFGFYTGRTPENLKNKEGRTLLANYKAQNGEPIENEILTREEMRANPPQILFTNYSMLEYLLIRPTDESLISQEALKHLRFIVLDEAHTYKGALGIEISLLLRRLKGVANRKPQFVLTSATLGRGTEDLPKIIDFASKLTTSEYENDDVIFGIRHENKEETKYTIYPEDYKEIYENKDNIDIVKTIVSKYIEYDENVKLNVNLYNLLLHDGNTKRFFDLTKNVGNFYNVCRSLGDFRVDELTSLVELIMMSASDDSKYPLKLYDVKYHMFMKAPDGAFVTLGKNKDLSLTTVNQINGNKAFKIGICQNCKVPYIMGITEDNILCVDDEIDIDESYADKAKRLEYYLISDCLSNDEIDDLENDETFEKYVVCTKCGYIKKASSAIKKNDCEHLKENQTVLYKYKGKNSFDKDDEDIITNNLHKCPICDYKSNSGGVIMGFHVGKDRATTLIAQILYESMEYPIEIEKASEFSLFDKEDKIIQLRKQFLAFSDSRQQAAFFSKFLNSNNDRFMKKSMIWELLKRNNHNEISYLDLVSRLDTMFRRELRYSDSEAIKHAKAAALWELMLVDGRNSGEGIGLYAFMLDLNRGHYIEAQALESMFASKGFENITAEQIKTLTAQLFTIFRTSPSIEYEHLGTDDFEERKELLGYRQKNVYISLKEPKRKGEDRIENYPVKSFLPVEDDPDKKSSVNSTVKYVMKAMNYPQEKAIKLIRYLWELAKEERILVGNSYKEYPNTYLTKAEDYTLHSYKNLKFYKCNKCNKLTLYNVNDACTNPDCDGRLEPCNVEVDKLFANNYYRNEYLTRPIEHLICKEHTAQLNADQAKAIQDDFKDKHGEINFISCSTTFEMGIDLGGLNTIFMRNVPPTPANYAQRAGRAGRRAETSAFVLTFCSTSSHDYTYFSEPEEMIRGLVKPPYFVVDNDKIIMRHITATALSLYFKEPEYKEDYDSITHFIEENVKDKFIKYIKSKPEKLGHMIDDYLLIGDDIFEKYGNFKWIDYLEVSESALSKMTDGLKSLIKMYKDAEEYEEERKHWDLCKSYQEALRRMNSKNSFISYFTQYNVIPGYGFPVDNVELHIYDRAKRAMSDEYNLSRDLSIAISEYAPGSEIIVDGKKYTSRYITLPYNGSSGLPTEYYCECPKCHTINTSAIKSDFESGCLCKYCGTELDVTGRNIKKYVVPIYGFVADRNNKNTRRMKPFKTYASDTYYIGKSLDKSDDKNKVISVKEYKDEELLVLNENNFYMCDACGYTDLDKKNKLTSKNKAHKDFKDSKCAANKLSLVHLGHSYKTDIVKVEFNCIDEMQDYETALSVLYALLEGISMTYSIERSDIGGMTYRVNSNKPYDLILYDTVAGGAGHVKRLVNSVSLADILQNALKKVSQECCDSDTSCYNCIRTYNNQRVHKHLKRGLAKNALEHIIEKIQNNIEYTIDGPSLSFASHDVDEVVNSALFASTSYDTFRHLRDELRLKNKELPDGYGYTLESEPEDKVFYADFAWTSENILLFTNENVESFENLVNTQSKFKCYLLSESFDYVKFTEMLGE